MNNEIVNDAKHKIINDIVELGFTLVSSKKQRSNRTSAFKSNKSGDVFTVHTKTGYIRKTVFNYGLMGGTSCYQLNRKDKYGTRILEKDATKLYALMFEYLKRNNK